jgi:hypothetical protein
MMATSGQNITNYMDLSPSWEATNHAGSQELPNILLNPKVNYHVHKSSPLVPILSQINPFNTTPSYLSKISFSIIPPTCVLVSLVAKTCKVKKILLV